MAVGDIGTSEMYREQVNAGRDILNAIAYIEESVVQEVAEGHAVISEIQSDPNDSIMNDETGHLKRESEHDIDRSGGEANSTEPSLNFAPPTFSLEPPMRRSGRQKKQTRS